MSEHCDVQKSHLSPEGLSHHKRIVPEYVHFPATVASREEEETVIQLKGHTLLMSMVQTFCDLVSLGLFRSRD